MLNYAFTSLLFIKPRTRAHISYQQLEQLPNYNNITSLGLLSHWRFVQVKCLFCVFMNENDVHRRRRQNDLLGHKFHSDRSDHDSSHSYPTSQKRTCYCSKCSRSSCSAICANLPVPRWTPSKWARPHNHVLGLDVWSVNYVGVNESTELVEAAHLRVACVEIETVETELLESDDVLSVLQWQ